MSEQDRLSRLVEGGFDPDAAKDMIADSLRASIGGINPDKIDQVRREILASEGTSKKDKYIKEYLGKTSSDEKAPITQIKSENIQIESLLIGLYEIYDGLIDIFQRIGINHEISDKLTTQIWNLEKSMAKLGGTIEKTFVPEDYVSGLENPNLEENAVKVISTTKRCYKLGSIENEKIEEGGNTIRLTFKGSLSSSGVKYVAQGVIKAGVRGWTGSEAIDYIYKTGGGKMSVRSFEGGKWINCSENFDIKWELEEHFPETKSKEEIDENFPVSENS